MRYEHLIEPQVEFPNVGLSRTNVRYFTFVIENSKYVRVTHKIAENYYPIFYGTHNALSIATNQLFRQKEHLVSIETGIMSFEAITSLVLARRLSTNIPILTANISKIVNPKYTDKVAGYFAQNYDTFVNTMSSTARAVDESTARYGLNTELVLLGAGIAHGFQRDNTDG